MTKLHNLYKPVSIIRIVVFIAHRTEHPRDQGL